MSSVDMMTQEWKNFHIATSKLRCCFIFNITNDIPTLLTLAECKTASNKAYYHQTSAIKCTFTFTTTEHSASEEHKRETTGMSSREASQVFVFVLRCSKPQSYSFLSFFRPVKKQEDHGPPIAHLIKITIAYLQMSCNFFQYCHSN